MVKPGGKAFIQTLEKSLMNHTLQHNNYWKLETIHFSDCGGFNVGIFVLLRSSEEYVELKQSVNPNANMSNGKEENEK